jgi:hypothetical protein
MVKRSGLPKYCISNIVNEACWIFILGMHLAILTVMFAYKQILFFAAWQSFKSGTLLSRYLVRATKSYGACKIFLKLFCFNMLSGMKFRLIFEVVGISMWYDGRV